MNSKQNTLWRDTPVTKTSKSPHRVLADLCGDPAGLKPGEWAQWERDSRIVGCLVGGVVGDALGSPYEFRTPPLKGHARFGRGTFGHKAGQGTDDSEQSLVVCLAKSDPAQVAAGLLEWFDRHYGRGITNALDPFQSAHAQGHGRGC